MSRPKTQLFSHRPAHIRVLNADHEGEKMRKALLIIIGLLLASIFARAQGSGAAQHQHPRELSLAAAGQDWARQRLEKSLRHQEWVQIKNGSRTINSFIVYPEVKSKAMAVVVI